MQSLLMASMTLPFCSTQTQVLLQTTSRPLWFELHPLSVKACDFEPSLFHPLLWVMLGGQFCPKVMRYGKKNLDRDSRQLSRQL